MSYNPAIDMPQNAEERRECIDYYWHKSQDEHAAAVEAATAQYAALPDTDDKPTLEDYVSMVVEPAQTREEVEQIFKSAGYYPQEQPVFAEAELTLEQKLAQARDMIDAETSAAILAGFDYEINGENLHFNYDAFDQQNFADTANGCLMQKAGLPGLPETVGWNAYRHNGELVRLTLTADEFLALYAGGALAHKAVCMETGGQKKAALA